jgi:hypothetical protein
VAVKTDSLNSGMLMKLMKVISLDPNPEIDIGSKPMIIEIGQ